MITFKGTQKQSNLLATHKIKIAVISKIVAKSISDCSGVWLDGGRRAAVHTF